MATSTLVPLSEYLRSSYHPDCEWIDGQVRERNTGEGQHGELQKFFIVYFAIRQREWGIRVIPEQRVQTAATHFRVPDVCVVRAGTFEAIVRRPPLLCIEILSPEDRLNAVQEKAEEYFAMGVTAVWVIDPRRRRAFLAMSDGSLHLVADFLTVDETPIRVPVHEIFLELDMLEGRTPEGVE